MEADGKPYRLYFYTSPYKRSNQTYQALAENFSKGQIAGQQEEVQLREQDFGNFQACLMSFYYCGAPLSCQSSGHSSFTAKSRLRCDVNSCWQGCCVQIWRQYRLQAD